MNRADRISRISTYEHRKAQGVAMARQIGTILRRAGFVKCGPYSCYRSRTAGFNVGERGNGTEPVPTATVSHVSSQHGREKWPKELDGYEAAIVADGRFVVSREYGSLVVTRKA